MTETENDTNIAPAEKPDAPSMFDQPEGRDWFLALHIWEAEAAGISKPLTVWLKGSLITGTVISGKQFFEETGRLVIDGAKGDSDLANLQRSLGKNYADFAQLYERNKDAPLEEFKPAYLHLKGARTVIGSNFVVPDNPGGLLRIRASSVDAVMMGELQFG